MGGVHHGAEPLCAFTMYQTDPFQFRGAFSHAGFQALVGLAQHSRRALALPVPPIQSPAECQQDHPERGDGHQG